MNSIQIEVVANGYIVHQVPGIVERFQRSPHMDVASGEPHVFESLAALTKWLEEKLDKPTESKPKPATS